jgi:transposase
VSGVRFIAFRAAGFGCCHEVSPSRARDGALVTRIGLVSAVSGGGLKRMRSVLAQAVKNRSMLAVEARRDPASAAGAIRWIADQFGFDPEALRTWVKRIETDAGDRPGSTSSEAERIAGLERGNRELRRANQILKSAASFFATELDRPSR